MDRPKSQRNEKPAVTVANLRRENDNLVKRVEELYAHNIDLDHAANGWREEATGADLARHKQQEIIDLLNQRLEEAQAKIAKLESIMCGYRQAIADIYGQEAPK